jgi:hypothetical protein
MDETFEVPEMSAAEIEGRLIAQRHALQWLLMHVAKHDVDVSVLLNDLNERWPPADAQEDPGAVPANGYAIFSAATAEMRLLLEPLKQSRMSAAGE